MLNKNNQAISIIIFLVKKKIIFKIITVKSTIYVCHETISTMRP